MAKIFLILGPVGAGKSTFSRILCEEKHAIHFALDDWMSNLFSADRPEEGVMEWYQERAKRCIAQIWKLTEQIISNDINVVLELGLIRKQQRLEFHQYLTEKNHALVIYILDAPRDIRRQRVDKRNLEQGETFSMIVPLDVFELASDLWEPVSDAEFPEAEIQRISAT